MRLDPQLLLIDDDEIDIRVLRRALLRITSAENIHVARDGRGALEILAGFPDHPPLRRPHLILLDLKMPRMGGLEFLSAIRSDPTLRDSVVMVLTTSDDLRDREQAYNFGAAAYMLKPSGNAQAAQITEMIDKYLQTVLLPLRPEGWEATAH